MPDSSTTERVDEHLPITCGRLMDFPEDPIGTLRRLHARHGDVWALQEDDQRFVFVAGPHYNQQVLADPERFHSRFFALRGPRRSAQRRVTSGLLSMNGAEHKQHRRAIMGPFGKKWIGNYHDTIARLADEMLAEWHVGEEIDVNREMLHYMLRLTSAILFGVDVPEFAYHLGTMIDDWVHLNHETGIAAFVSAPELNDKYDELLAKAEQLEQDLLTLIDMRRRSGDDRIDVLSLLIRAADEEGTVSDEQLSGHVALLYGAAHLTTAHTLSWTLFLLAQHPETARAAFGETTAAFDGLVPDADVVNRVPLMERIVKESMRLLPASAYVQRVNVVPVQLGPLSLPPGTPVVWSQFLTHHLPELYPEPERFDPDRWLTIKPSPYEYLPFGAGPRMCIGAPLATRILQTALPMILKRFRLSCVADSRVDAQVVSTTFGPESGLWMEIHEPDGRFVKRPVQGNVHGLVDLQPPAERRRAA